MAYIPITVTLAVGDELIKYPGITGAGELIVGKKKIDYIISIISNGEIRSRYSRRIIDFSNNPKWYVNGKLYDISKGDNIIIPTGHRQQFCWEPEPELEIAKNASVNIHIEKAKELLDNIAKCEESKALALNEFTDYVKNNF